MRKRIAALIVCTVVISTILMLPVNGEAVGVSVGLNTWYAKWKLEDPNGTLKSKWTPMYGPVVGADFAKNWSVTSVLLTGNFKFEDIFGTSTDQYFRRYDSDTTLNYSIFRWLKVFGGLKYLRFDSKIDGDEVSLFGSAEYKHYTYGPGFGLGLTVPVFESLYAIANISGMYLSGKSTDPVLDNTRWIEKGYNAAMSLAYYIESIATTISAGVRYQSYDSEKRNSDSDSTKMRIHGITFSAVYNFNLDPAE